MGVWGLGYRVQWKLFLAGCQKALANGVGFHGFQVQGSAFHALPSQQSAYMCLNFMGKHLKALAFQ